MDEVNSRDYEKIWDEIYESTAPVEAEKPLEPVRVSHKKPVDNRKAKTAATVFKAVLIGFCMGFLPYVLDHWHGNPRLWAVPLTPLVLYLIYSLITDLKGWLKRDEDL